MTQYKETPFEDDAPAPSATPNRHLRRRIDREVIILSNQESQAKEKSNEAEAPEHEESIPEELDDAVVDPMGDDNEEEYAIEEEADEQKREKSLFEFVTSGMLLTYGAVPYYRYFIAIAIMCFLSIFFTFMSLNTDLEYRRKENKLTMLHERAVVKEEQRYGLSSKRAITARLKQHNIELIDLSKDSRLIER